MAPSFRSIREGFFRAERAFRDGKNDSSRRLFQELLGLLPGNARCYQALGIDTKPKEARVPHVAVLENPIFAQDCVKSVQRLGCTAELVPVGTYLPNFFRRSSCDLFLTININPPCIRSCVAESVPYVAWQVDPQFHSFDPEVFSPDFIHPLVFLCSFDKSAVALLKEKGFSQVYYLPLATDREHFFPIARSLPAYDISYAGTIPQSNNEFSGLVADAQARADAARCPWNKSRWLQIRSALQSYSFQLDGKTSHKDLLDFVAELPRRFDFPFPPPEWNYIVPGFDHQLLANVIGKQLSVAYRVSIVGGLSQGGLHVAVFGNDDWKAYTKLGFSFHGMVEHRDPLNLLYNQSKINLNISRNYSPAVPMRVFDAAASGSFVLSDNPTLLNEFFDLEHEIVCYRDHREALLKARYYLEHEGERRAIAARGHARVLKDHLIEHRLKYVLEMLSETLMDPSFSQAAGSLPTP